MDLLFALQIVARDAQRDLGEAGIFQKQTNADAARHEMKKAAEKAREEAEKKMQAEAPAVPEEVDFYIRLTDHKKVGGLMLPHKLTFLTDNEVSEEFEISKYQLNPQFKADRFEKH